MLSETNARATLIGAAVFIALIPFSTAARAGAIDLQTRHEFKIPAERLNVALAAFSAQTRIHVRTSRVPSGVLSPGVRGDLPTLDALTALLRGTGMSFRQIDAETIVVVSAETAQLRPTQFQLIGDMDSNALATQPTAGAAPAAAAPAELTEVQVTGTRIVREGYEAPTPVTVVGLTQLQDVETENIADALNEMPVFSGSSTPTTTGISDGPGGGANNLNLRGLGTNRLLVLFDGRRVPAESTNVVDTNMLPDALVQRVDVVTGGASSVYGSDAVAGVVNYVLNTNFNGIQGLIQGGDSIYGDGKNDKIQLTLGTAFAGGRGHIEVSGDQIWQALIPGTARAWNMQGAFIIQNPAYNANTNPKVPSLIHAYDVGLTGGNPGGIIYSGPLKGTAFTPDGTQFQWNYGSLQVGQYQVGGDWATSSMQGSESIQSGTNQSHFFADVRFDVTDHFQVFAQFNNGSVHTDDHCCYVYYLTGNLALSSYNPYLPASVAGQAAAAGVNSFAYSMTFRNDPAAAHNGFNGFGDINTRWNDIYTIGAKGDFTLLKTNWNWNWYAQSGIATENVFVPSQSITANLMDALQAVRVGTYEPGGTSPIYPAYTAAAYPNPLNIPKGTITCLSNLLPVAAVGETNNCTPFNPFATGENTAGAWNYFMNGPWERYSIYQNVTGGSVTGEPFSLWAGPVSLAAEAEYRTDGTAGQNDPISPNIGWFSTQLTTIPDASQFVYEGALETVVPLLKDLPAVKELDFNSAVRFTDYSTSGYVDTWKLGLEWTPFPDLRFRFTESRDIRAPTLNDLDAPPSINHNTINDPFLNNQSYPYYQISLGNPQLKPERGLTQEFGVVFQPVEVPGLGLSVDYWSVDIKGEISTVSYNYVLTQCYASKIGNSLTGTSAYCADIVRFASGANVNTLYSISVGPLNFAEGWKKGVDYEFSYAKNLTEIVSSWKGNLSFRLDATETLETFTNSGIPGPTEIINGESAAVRWPVYGTLTYTLDPWRFTWTSIYNSSHALSATDVACTNNCPTVASGFTGIDTNHVASWINSNFTINYKFIDQAPNTAEAFFSIQNVFNRDPVINPQQPAGATYALHSGGGDTIGLQFRAGIRFHL